MKRLCFILQIIYEFTVSLDGARLVQWLSDLVTTGIRSRFQETKVMTFIFGMCFWGVRYRYSLEYRVSLLLIIVRLESLSHNDGGCNVWFVQEILGTEFYVHMSRRQSAQSNRRQHKAIWEFWLVIHQGTKSMNRKSNAIMNVNKNLFHTFRHCHARSSLVLLMR